MDFNIVNDTFHLQAAIQHLGNCEERTSYDTNCHGFSLALINHVLNNFDDKCFEIDPYAAEQTLRMLISANTKKSNDLGEMIEVLEDGQCLISFHIWDVANTDYILHSGIILPHEYQVSEILSEKNLLVIEREAVTNKAKLYVNLSNAIAMKSLDCSLKKFSSNSNYITTFCFWTPNGSSMLFQTWLNDIFPNLQPVDYDY